MKIKIMKNLLFALALILGLSAQSQTNLIVAQDFTVTDVHGNSHNLFTYLDSNKHVILDFFFTTCGPCINSVPTVNAFFTAFGCNTGDVIFLSIDANDTDAEVLQYEIDYGTLLPAASGLDGGGNAVITAYGINAFPTCVLIAPNRDIIEQDIWPVSGIDVALLNAGVSQNSCIVVSVPELNIETNYKIFDVFGREWSDYKSLPYGLYIQNGKKYIKMK